MSRVGVGTGWWRSAVVLVAGVVVVFGVAWAVVADPGADPEGGPQVQTLVYGDAPSMFGRLHLPDAASSSFRADASGPAPVVVLVHGGFWRRQGGDLALMEPLAVDLARGGYAVWNIEYGRTGERFGGWPHTFNHVAAAVDHLVVLAREHPLDLDDVTVVGHSAGGHLAVWLAGREAMPARSAWDPAVDASVPAVSVGRAIGLAPILDVRSAGAELVGNGAVVDLLGGGPDDVALRYVVATPAPADGVEVWSVVGGADDIVPARLSEAPGVGLVTVPGVDHLGLIDPDGAAWVRVLELLNSGGRE